MQKNIIDIRASFDYEAGHIKDAINIREDLLLNNPECYLNKNDTYYIYCETGSRSRMVCNRLNARGYNTFNIKGGYKKYLIK